jgi:endonuclease YncB( thermonuclease family)
MIALAVSDERADADNRVVDVFGKFVAEGGLFVPDSPNLKAQWLRADARGGVAMHLQSNRAALPLLAGCFLNIVFLACAFHAVAGADELRGIPRIVDGDTVQIGASKLRLVGIDAPETDQLCLNSDGKRWACGIEARDRLIHKAGGKVWLCRTNSVDRYGRRLATCDVDGININRWLVREGWALSFVRYSHEYDSDEALARQARAGLWSGAFIAPWDWRSRNKDTMILGPVSVPIDAQSILLSRASAIEPPSGECIIKGNVNRHGECIYHVPGGRYYDIVNMDLSKGKRWFCTEAEAAASGCRRSKQ